MCFKSSSAGQLVIGLHGGSLLTTSPNKKQKDTPEFW